MPSEISIQCLLSAGRLESFTKAAEELFMTRQAVSRQIAHLEKELGAQLFQRNTAKVELTAVGELYWQFFCQTQAEWEETQRKAEMILNAQGNLVHIGCNHDLNLGEWVLLIIEKCQSNGYSLGVDWERREPHDLLEPLLAGQLDVVFSFERALDDFKQADALEHVPIVQAQAVLVVRDSHPLAVPGACAQDFQDVPCFISEQMTPPTQKRLSFEAEWSAYGIRFSDVHIVPNRESMQTMVEMGRGVTISTNVDSISYVSPSSQLFHQPGPNRGLHLAKRRIPASDARVFASCSGELISLLKIAVQKMTGEMVRLSSFLLTNVVKRLACHRIGNLT